MFLPYARSPASPSLSMARTPTKICLQKTLKEGLRRCVYRRWQAEVKGNVLITKTTDLERMYRGNTPYPLGAVTDRRRVSPDNATAKVNLAAAIKRRKQAGYTVR